FYLLWRVTKRQLLSLFDHTRLSLSLGKVKFSATASYSKQLRPIPYIYVVLRNTKCMESTSTRNTPPLLGG
ncbi:hypothetical protein R7O13_26350, partial [Vibrio sp. Y176]|uniref:hypothetical protein n=1 Tax=Vibrio sp. Y176 TaxID=3074704 RepID=UPI002965B888